MSVPLSVAVQRMQAFRRALPVAIIRGMRKGLPIAVKLAKTKYMQRKSNLHPFKAYDPPNPPPGPLGIRSGKLARSVRVGEIRYTGRQVIGSIEAGDAQTRYAKVHELGMRIFARGPALVFPIGFPGGFRMVRKPNVLIKPRPYLTPSLEDAQEQIEKLVALEVVALARATLKDMMRSH